jgi:hypothetical protein
MKALILSFLFLPLVTLLEIELEKRSLLDNKIEIRVPKEFVEMPKEMVAIKYPGQNKPKLILTNEATTTNLAFSLTSSEANPGLIKTYKDLFVQTYKTSFPSATWLSEGITEINGKQVGYLKLITEAADQKIFNYVFFTDLEGKLLIGTFNCVEKDMKVWQPVGEEMVESLRVK